jgi:hypothetical protein
LKRSEVDFGKMLATPSSIAAVRDTSGQAAEFFGVAVLILDNNFIAAC